NANRNLGVRGGASCGFMVLLHGRNEANPAWNYVDSGRSDLPHFTSSSSWPQHLFCPSDECRHVCIDRYDHGNHAPALPTSPLDFKLTHYPTSEPLAKSR